jgi:transposase
MTKARLIITAVVLERRRQGEVARAYGVSPGWVSRLVARYRAEGEAAFEPRSRRPKTSPTALDPGAVELIVRLRKQLAEQGLDAGPHTIAWHLAHRHGVTVSTATVARCLARHGLITPAPGKRPKASYIRFEAAMPNQCWQADFTHYRLTRPRRRARRRDGGVDLAGRLLPLRVVGHRPRPRDRPDRARRVPQNRRHTRDPGVHADGHSSWVASRRSVDRPAGGVRIDGSGTRSSSLLDRSERIATSCLLTMLAGGASAGEGPPC